MLTIKDLGERELLDRLSQFCAEGVVGDDAAIIDISAEQKLVVTTDVLVENVHFSDRTTPALSVGWRAVAANLSDLAAMGATPKAITVGLSLRKDVAVDWIEEVYRGMKQCLDQFATPIIGGDLTRSEVNTIAITALGEVSAHQTILRHLAQPQDLIVISGEHGLSKAGLELSLYPDRYQSVSAQSQAKLIAAHQYPQPRFDLVQKLRQLNCAHPIAGMDSSDGLADAIIQMCQLSQVGAQIDGEAIPISSAILELADLAMAWEWCLYGGEDFELVLCLPPQLAHNLKQEMEPNVFIIGEITESSPIELVNVPLSYPKLLLKQSKTFQHF